MFAIWYNIDIYVFTKEKARGRRGSRGPPGHPRAHTYVAVPFMEISTVCTDSSFLTTSFNNAAATMFSFETIL